MPWRDRTFAAPPLLLQTRLRRCRARLHGTRRSGTRTASSLQEHSNPQIVSAGESGCGQESRRRESGCGQESRRCTAREGLHVGAERVLRTCPHTSATHTHTHAVVHKSSRCPSRNGPAVNIAPRCTRKPYPQPRPAPPGTLRPPQPRRSCPCPAEGRLKKNKVSSS